MDSNAEGYISVVGSIEYDDVGHPDPCGLRQLSTRSGFPKRGYQNRLSADSLVVACINRSRIGRRYSRDRLIVTGR